jgi:uncharacterized membrane protein
MQWVYEGLYWRYVHVNQIISRANWIFATIYSNMVAYEVTRVLPNHLIRK